MVSVALIGLAALAMLTIFSKVTNELQVAGARNNHTVMRMSVRTALENPFKCATRLVGTTPLQPMPGSNSRLSGELSQILGEGDLKLVGNSDKIENVQYRLKIEADSSPYASYNGGTLYRPDATQRFQGWVVISGILAERPAPIEARIPISLELRNSDRSVVSCTTSPMHVEQHLARGGDTKGGVLLPFQPIGHTASDCAAINGVPLPTRYGLICRVPNPNPTYQLDVSCPATGNWMDSHFLSVESRAYAGQRCKQCVINSRGNLRDSSCRNVPRFFSDKPVGDAALYVDDKNKDVLPRPAEVIEYCEYKEVDGHPNNWPVGLGVGGAVSFLGADPVTAAIAGLIAAFGICPKCDDHVVKGFGHIIARGCY
jgi:hypothetical protein